MRRFWSRVNKSDGCWEFSSLAPNGYGQMMVFLADGRKTMMGAHRLSVLISDGEIPDGMFACHHCDNRACIRRDHIFVGTPSDNLQDMSRKGRGKKTGNSGETNAAAKITATTAEEICRRFDDGWSLGAVAHRYGISKSQAFRIVRGQAWHHLGITTHQRTRINRIPEARDAATGRFVGGTQGAGEKEKR